jgi:hypothetical protein
MEPEEIECTNEEFDEAVRDLAEEDGVQAVLLIPGVWELVSEYYNNEALDKIEDDRATAAEEAE